MFEIVSLIFIIFIASLIGIFFLWIGFSPLSAGLIGFFSMYVVAAQM